MFKILKKALHQINSKLEFIEEKMCEFKTKIIETVQNEMQENYIK